MTRKISNQAAAAFFAGRNFRAGNTEVCAYMGGLVELCLHGHKIASYGKYGDRHVRFTLAGWNTITTKDRLRALGIDVRNVRGQPTWEGTKISANQSYDSGIIA